MIFKCKPCWNFQSVEFEYEGEKEDLPKIMDLYSDVLSRLMLISPEQKKDAPAVKLASDKQKEIMRKFDIPFTIKTTSEEAQKLIQESIDKTTKQIKIINMPLCLAGNRGREVYHV